MRPNLTKDMTAERFKDFYWLKEELQAFCRHYGISTSGSKSDLTDRIEVFLMTGEVNKPIRQVNLSRKNEPKAALSLDTVITENHRCSQEVRAFFQAIIPKFHFSTYIQNFFRNNAGKTYREAVEAWHEEEQRKKDPAFKKEIAPQFEYNQFFRDFFADPNNQGKSREEAIAAWNRIKKLPGSNKYVPNE